MAFATLLRILMVEDETDIQAVAQLALESIGGFEVCISGSGHEAIQAGAAFAPDLILMDVMMPGMDGPSTLRALRELPQTTRTPVIFMTAKALPQELDQYKQLGVLDVIAKPFDPMTLSATIMAVWERYTVGLASAQLQALADAYAAHVPARLAEIVRAWESIQLAWAADKLAELHRLAHNLYGTSATHGFDRLAKTARDLESALAQLRTLAHPTEAQIAGAAQHLGALISAAQPVIPAPQLANLAALDALPAPASPLHSTGERRIAHREPGWRFENDAPSPSARAVPLANAEAGAERNNRLIYIAAVEPMSAAILEVQLGHFGFVVQIFATLDDLSKASGQTDPAAIITDADALVPGNASRELLASILNACALAPPLVVVADRSGLDTRLCAVRAGANAFFSRPVNVNALVDKLDSLTAHHALEPYRILIVDDELELANYYAAVLRQAGISTIVVTEPLSIMQPLVEFRPDMILMDMYMPSCDGMDLAAVIRQQEDYVSIPIVFVSAETNLDMQLEAMRLGGDDFLTKPVKPDYLISSVTNRIERSRVLRSFMLRDSLTGLFNHTATKERLEAELARARRYHAPLSFAIIDIDHFKSVNDSYGHPIGDRVLKSLARLLQQRLRRTDIIGRYGGEEFAVVLAGTDGPAAVMVMDEIRAGLAQIRQQASEREFTVTFSCGVASYSGYPDAPTLTDAADKALYRAKHGGRNRVVLADEPEQPGS